MKVTLNQILIWAAVLIYLTGAIFMLVNVFGGFDWAFWVGIGSVTVASVLVVWSVILEKKSEKANIH